ncbi:OmpH family outer membrane protein [Fluviicola taffensis]|uniref:Outer membrane chaperone Skp (OmpH) n=1 Tax=Fluviicola taffensis (strain DSM 16823 / NCIMB 13979 / RW262) TaxID=755732 RepID=F2IGX8_FLUTR|nr:OmpH family outer membrane protein [Fluviicola taffensis]AEA44759.1 outer membrane chaperone Skp (OmpH) [Fluviicola taffensis DSM 16823]
MKLGYLIATGLILGVTTFACSDKKEETKTKEETAPVVPTVSSKGLKMAFYYSDSLKEGFTYYKNEDARITKKGEAFQNDLMARQRSLEQQAATYEKYMREGTATGEQLQTLENDIMRKREQLMNLQQSKGAQLEKETNEALTVLGKKIEVAGKKYCEKYGIDMLLIHGQGGQINFINEKMNVTQSFIDFLNHEQESMEKELQGK